MLDEIIWREITHVEYEYASADGLISIDIEPDGDQWKWYGTISHDEHGTLASTYDHAPTADDAKADATAWLYDHADMIERLMKSEADKS